MAWEYVIGHMINVIELLNRHIYILKGIVNQDTTLHFDQHTHKLTCFEL